MRLFHVDSKKCNQDGLCVLECPARILEMNEEGPQLPPAAEAFCIQCGHCVAVCPTSAVRMAFLSPGECLPIQKEAAADKQQMETFLRTRRSIRQYKKMPVSRELLEKAFKVAACAPTGSNKQPVRWLIFDNRSDVQKIAGHVTNWMRHVSETRPEMAQMMNFERIIAHCSSGVDRICRDAPMMVFSHASNEFGSAAADCHTSLAYLELALPSLGLGSCWAGYVYAAAGQWPELKQMLALPENHTCHGALMVGIPKFRFRRAPKRNAPVIEYRN